MIALSLHLAPNAPWLALLALSLAFLALGLWAYRFAVPPLPRAARRLLPVLRVAALLLAAWLLAQPVLERSAGGRAGVVVLLDRSASMELPVAPGAARRSEVAAAAVRALERAWHGRARVTVLPFAARLGTEPARADGGGGTGATALGDALTALAASPAGQDAGAVVVVSDGAVNAGEDPVAAARALGLPVHAVVVGRADVPDRVVSEVEAQEVARTGQPTVVRAWLTSTEERGTPLTVRLLEEGRELARAAAIAPGGGAEAAVEFRVVPARPGLAVWTVRTDSLPGELTTANDARQVAVEVAPGRLGVLLVSGELNWDLTFLRRALHGDSSLAVTSFVRERGGWRPLERPTDGSDPRFAWVPRYPGPSAGFAPGPGPGPGPARSAGVPRAGTPRAGAPRAGTPAAADLRGQAVVVLDGVAAGEVSADFERSLAGFVRGGGGLLVLGGPAPGLARHRGAPAGGVPTPGVGPGRLLGPDLGVTLDAGSAPGRGAPEPVAAARELVAWDTDPARGERAWREAAPLADVAPVRPGAGDRVLIGSAGGGPPLLLARRVGRGQALLVNGTGFWRWSLSGVDELTAERGRALWRRLVHWLAEPAQAEPLRVVAERRLAASGEPVRLFATLQDSAFRPLAGAEVTGELRGPSGRARPVRFEPGGLPGATDAAGSYVAVLEDLPPARYRLSARAVRGGRELGRAGCEFAVDRWSLELARSLPDSAALAAVAAAGGGRVGPGPTPGVGTPRAGAPAADVERWARSLPAQALARRRLVSQRLWESPVPYALIVALLSMEWFWRRRRGLP